MSTSPKQVEYTHPLSGTLKRGRLVMELGDGDLSVYETHWFDDPSERGEKGKCKWKKTPNPVFMTIGARHVVKRG